jgi:secreted trypsin-like serine protease
MERSIRNIHFKWGAFLGVWTILLVVLSIWVISVRQRREYEVRFESIRKPRAVEGAPRSVNVQALELVLQSQQVSDFIQSGPPLEERQKAEDLLATTNRQVALASSKQNLENLGFVWSGATVADKGQFPYQVGVVFNNFVPYASRGFHCGGVLVAPTWVLTAGHCFEDDSQATDFQVFAGHLNLSESPQPDCNCWVQIANLYRHPTYQLIDTQYGQIIDGDVALLQLKSPLSLGTLKIAQAESEPAILKSRLGTIVGWGKSTANPSSLSDALLYGTVKITADSPCANAFVSGVIRPDMICATPYPASACNGDSGGPLIGGVDAGTGAAKIEYVEGIVSWGYPLGACPPSKPTVFSRLPTKVLSDWITQCISGQTCPSSIKKQ